MLTMEPIRALPVEKTLRRVGLLAAAGLCILAGPASSDESRVAAIGIGDAVPSIEESDGGDVANRDASGDAMRRKVRDDLDFQRASRAYLWALPMVGSAPEGLAYWERLADLIQRMPVTERDQVMLATLKPLGIEKGKPFRPDERQKRLLELGAAMGGMKVRANRQDRADLP